MPETSAPSAPPPAAPSAPSSGAAPAKKGSNVCIIILIIFLALVVLGGIGGYFAYRYAKNKVKTTVSNVSDLANNASVSTSNSSDVYGDTKDQSPTGTYAKTIDTDCRKVLGGLFGAAKLSIWTADESSATFSYVTKNTVSASDYSKVEAAFLADGWTKSDNVTSSDGFVLTLTKADSTLSVFTTGAANQYSISVNAYKSVSTE